MSYRDKKDLLIRRFKPDEMAQSSIVFIIGKRGSGKSTVAESVLSHFTHIKEGFCISKTNTMNGFWSRHLPSLFIHNEYNEALTYRLIDHQEKKWQAHKKACKARGETPNIEDIDPVFAIYDDVTFDESFLRDRATRELFMNGRHYKILVIITCQYMLDMKPALRNQIDYVFYMRDNIHANLEKFHTHFAGVFSDLLHFKRTFKKCTEDRGALVLDNTANSSKVTDCVFWFRAKPDLQYRLGSDEFWEYARENCVEDGAREDETAGLSKKEAESMKSFTVEKLEESDSEEEDDAPVSTSAHWALSNTVPLPPPRDPQEGEYAYGGQNDGWSRPDQVSPSVDFEIVKGGEDEGGAEENEPAPNLLADTNRTKKKKLKRRRNRAVEKPPVQKNAPHPPSSKIAYEGPSHTHSEPVASTDRNPREADENVPLPNICLPSRPRPTRKVLKTAVSFQYLPMETFGEDLNLGAASREPQKISASARRPKKHPKSMKRKERRRREERRLRRQRREMRGFRAAKEREDALRRARIEGELFLV